jgi:predicted phosphoribosyltransferase
VLFRDRNEAGEMLADVLHNLRSARLVVVGIAAGGVLVARVVADRLGAPLGAVRDGCLIGAPPATQLGGRTVLLVDEGVETGQTMRAAVTVIAECAPERIIAAVPVAPRRLEVARPAADLYAVARPDPFSGIRHWYAELPEVSEDEVRSALGDSQDWAYAGATSL